MIPRLFLCLALCGLVLAAAPFGGVNLAVLYGLLLILSAFVLALVYVFLVRRRADDSPTGPDDPRGGR